MCVAWGHRSSHEDAFAHAARQPGALVLVMLPGDVLPQRPLRWHAVLTRCLPDTGAKDCWAAVIGVVIMHKTEQAIADSLDFIRGGVSGQRKAATADADKYGDVTLRAYWALWRSSEAFDAQAALCSMRKRVHAGRGSTSERAAAASQAKHDKKRKRREHAMLAVAARAQHRVSV